MAADVTGESPMFTSAARDEAMKAFAHHLRTVDSPLIASAMVAAIGNGAAFAKGRDFAAWLGLVPKQMSTGDRTILGRISKRGNRYLRTLLMQWRSRYFT